MFRRETVMVVVGRQTEEAVAAAQERVIRLFLVGVNAVHHGAVVVNFAGEETFQAAVIVERLERPVRVIVGNQESGVIQFGNERIDGVKVPVIRQRLDLAAVGKLVPREAVEMIAAAEIGIFDHPIAHVGFIGRQRQKIVVCQFVVADAAVMVGVCNHGISAFLVFFFDLLNGPVAV